MWFSNNILGGSEPWSKQIEVMTSVRDNPRTAVKSGNGVGKTWTAAHVVLWFLTAYRPSRVITTAPTWQQVEKLLWAEINTQYKNALVPIGGKLLNTQLKIDDEHFAIGYSTDDATKFHGHHSEHILIVFDEAMGVNPAIWEGAEGMMTNAHARMLVIGNPTAPAGPFYKCFSSPIWNKITISCLDCPNVIADEIIYPRLVTKAWVDERRIEWGENSPEFKSRVLGEFPVEGEDTLIPLSWVEKALGRELEIQIEMDKILGVDVARYGDDSTVFIGLHGKKQIHESHYKGKNTTRTIGEIKNLVRESYLTGKGYTKIAIDDSGVGGGVTDAIDEWLSEPETKALYPDLILIPVNFGSSPIDKARFANLKAEIFWNLRLDFENDSLALQKSDNLLAELPTLMYKLTSKGQLAIVGKDEMKKLGLNSPDFADALAIAHYASYAGRAGILDFYKDETEHNVTTPPSIISQVATGTSVEAALRIISGRD